MRPLEVRAVGRVAVEPLPGGAKAYRHQWPGIYFEAAFRGDRLVLKFDDATNEYRLQIDDLPPIALVEPGAVEVRIGALPDGAHRLRLEKVTEDADHVGAFLGFYVPADAVPATVPPHPRQIEFIGDSSMSGYGNRSATRECPPDQIRRLTDTQLAYPALVAKRLDADYQVNAISGRGLVRNYLGMFPERALSIVYPQILFDGRRRPADPDWRPQIVVIKLNADFVTPLNPGEAWRTIPELGDAYVAAFGALIAEVARRSPGAAILIWWFDESGVPDIGQALLVGGWRLAITERARAARIASIDFLPIRDLGYEMSGCDSHYSLADHRKTADWLAAYLQVRPGLWQRPAR